MYLLCVYIWYYSYYLHHYLKLKSKEFQISVTKIMLTVAKRTCFRIYENQSGSVFKLLKRKLFVSKQHRSQLCLADRYVCEDFLRYLLTIFKLFNMSLFFIALFSYAQGNVEIWWMPIIELKRFVFNTVRSRSSIVQGLVTTYLFSIILITLYCNKNVYIIV